MIEGDPYIMGALTAVLHHMDWLSLLMFVMSGVACLICLTVHELSHGFVAYRLGDPTAKLNGRLTLNPISHIDWIGLFLLLAVGVGWAKPVPVDPRNFKNPRKGMALTALAGPLSNFLLALIALGVGSLLFGLGITSRPVAYFLLFLCQLAVLNVGLGLFNLIPIPPLDGSKVLNVLLPERAYQWVLRYERYLIVAVVLLAWSGFFGGPLYRGMAWVLYLFCQITQFPFSFIAACFF